VRLQISQVTVSLGETREKVLVQFKPGRRIDRVETILFIDRLPQHHSPFAVTLLKEVEEAAGANYVHLHVMHGSALANSHLGLGNRTIADNLGRVPP